MCTQHAWKPLVERRMHIETNKHTPFMFISSETTNKNKNGRKKETKKIYLDKKPIKKIFFLLFSSFLNIFFFNLIICYFIFLTKLHLFFLLFVASYD